MIDKIRIQNFKSIVDLEMDLGRINIIIGANGCGKTNILEAFAFASAANQDKLDNEFLINRGIRIPNPQFMKPAFEDIDEPKSIEISIYENNSSIKDTKVIFDKDQKKWEDVSVSTTHRRLQELIEKQLLKPQIKEKLDKELFSKLINFDTDNYNKILEEISKKIILNIIENNKKESDISKNIAILSELEKKQILPTFLIYSPNEYMLREQNLESAIRPMGVHGEGLFAYLKEKSSNKSDKNFFANINEGLYLLDWFDGVQIPKNLLSGESKLNIGDRYLKVSLHHFDQRSTNEGFLYLLFYLTLFNSKETPSFFAIDNIEASFNPKLCTRLIKHLIEVAKRNDKQVILTTHSPYVLDGLDLSDDEQRLFVARRDIDGHTRIERIPYRENRNMQLSDLWMNGLIGGLPDNF